MKAEQSRMEGDREQQFGKSREDELFGRLLLRLKTVQGELDTHPKYSSSKAVLHGDCHHEDTHFFPYYPDPPRERPSDVPVRFQAGRESLSVKKNITIRDQKKQKERTQDRDYKQRYSISPGRQVGVLGIESRINVDAYIGSCAWNITR